MKRSIAIILCIALIFTGCSKKDKDKTKDTSKVDSQVIDKPSIVEDINNTNTQKIDEITIFRLKTKYGVENKFEIKPFYNVSQTTSFHFHFNSYVDPFTAVTVHTDPKCETNSMVYQINTGYSSDSGMDVVVSPYNPVLNTNINKRLGLGNWGYAPIYYLKINYDIYSTSVKELDEPLIVPFTVKNSIGVPDVSGFVTEDGSFGIKWKPVNNAVAYNIYKSYQENTSYTRPELGYTGDLLNLVTKVDSNTLEFTGFGENNGDNISKSGKYVEFQNYYDLDNYYVTAIDSEGNESFYSIPVESWRYIDRLPYNFDSFNEFKRDSKNNIITLPEVVNVVMKDGSKQQFPINYTKINEQYEQKVYEYNISNTKLTGTVVVQNSGKEYGDNIKSRYIFETDLYNLDNTISIIPDVDANTISDEDYKQSTINIDEVIEKPSNGMIAYTRELLLIRAGIESSRMLNSGVYGDENPFTILSNNKQMIMYCDENGEPIDSSKIDGTYKDITSNSKMSKSDYINHLIPSIINQENLVTEQIISTNKQVDKANNKTVPNVDYKVFAESAEEEYIARSLIAIKNNIDLTAFPKLQNTEYLVDVLNKVITQNPYILGISKVSYNPNDRILGIEYYLNRDEIEIKQSEISKEVDSIVNYIVNNGMDTEEKIKAIWNYLEQNTRYDIEAIRSYKLNKDIPDEFRDSFNTYGIMCKKVGTSQSYAMSFKLLCDIANVESKVVTGYINKDSEHAWNIVKLGYDWFWIDSTINLKNSGIPFMLYQASSKYAIESGYIVDDKFDTNDKLNYILSQDNSRDYYSKIGMYFDNTEKAINSLTDLYIKSHEMSTVKCVVNYDIDYNVTDYIESLLYQKGISSSAISNLKLMYYNGIISIN